MLYFGYTLINFSSTSSKDDIEKLLKKSSMIHYAGHAEYNKENPSQGGWLVADGEFSPQDIKKLSGDNNPFPCLIFSNACHSGKTGSWNTTSDNEKSACCLANAFLFAGVQHYIGTFCYIPDEGPYYLALKFYQNLLNGMSVGKSLREGRQYLAHMYGEESPMWMAYMLYGNPVHSYFGKDIIQGAGEGAEYKFPSDIKVVPTYTYIDQFIRNLKGECIPCIR